MLKRFMTVLTLSFFTLTAVPIAASILDMPGYSAEAAVKKNRKRVSQKRGLNNKSTYSYNPTYGRSSSSYYNPQSQGYRR
jgi:hypothetical protein